MTRKLLLPISVLILLSATAMAQDDDRPKRKDLAWSVKADVFQMAAWTNRGTDAVFVAVRNSSPRTICYCAPPAEILPTVYAKRNGVAEWREIKLKTTPEPLVFVAVCNTVSLRPNEEMPSYSQRPGAASKKNNYSLAVDLREYDFPADWSGEVDVKFVLHLDYARGTNCAKPRKDVMVESKAFAVDLP